MKDAIGVIGGMGPLASQLFYKMITEHTAAECDQDHVPLLILSDVTMPDRTGAILDGKYDAPYNRLMEDAKFLEKYGCTAVVVTCNTAHFFMDMIEHELRIPFISMIRESAKEVASLHPGSVVAVQATDGTVKAGLYQRALEAEDLIPWVPDADIQKEVMYQIYDRIKKGLPCDKASWQKIEDACLEAGCSRVLLACTELSVIKSDEKLSDWYIDPMEILAKRVIEFSGKKYQ